MRAWTFEDGPMIDRQENQKHHRKQAEVPLLPVMEHFYTLQGEGAYQGHAAYFVRLAGCDVGCVWCDVKESWHTEGYPHLPVTALIEEARRHPARLLVTTGGEPLMYALDEWCNYWREAGFRLHLETSGAYPLSGIWDWICLSPKKFKRPHESVCQQADELKVVVYHKSDFAWAEEYALKVPDNCLLFLQPEWSRAQRLLPSIIEYVKANPRWRISLQTHKYMNIP